MKLSFAGFSRPIWVDGSAVSVLQLENRVLFARVCQSLSSQMGEDAFEPYTLWNDVDAKIKPSENIMYIGDPMSLPWSDKLFERLLFAKMNSLLFEEEKVRQVVEGLSQKLQSELSGLALQLDSSYLFAVDWDLKKYLKYFSFEVDLDTSDLLIDKLIKFLSLACDVSLGKMLVFVDLSLFLAPNEFKTFVEHAVFCDLNVLLIETVELKVPSNGIRRYAVDQDFIEFWPDDQQI